MIRGIADQTNLLALNAAIEAAGPASRGAASRWWPTRYATWPAARPPHPADHRHDRQDPERGGCLHPQHGEHGQQRLPRGEPGQPDRRGHRQHPEPRIQPDRPDGEISHTLREQSTAANEVVSTVGNITSLSEQSGTLPATSRRRRPSSSSCHGCCARRWPTSSCSCAYKSKTAARGQPFFW